MSDIQSQTDLFFVRQELAPTLPPPRTASGPIGWLRKNLFATPSNSVLSILGILFVIWALPPLLRWAIFDAQWTGATRDVCVANGAGACWAFVRANFGQFIFHFPRWVNWELMGLGYEH